LLEHLNPGICPRFAYPGIHPDISWPVTAWSCRHQPGDTRLALTAWPGVPARLTGHRSGALDGLEFSVAGNPGIEVELLPGAGIPVPLPARLGDGQDGGEEKGYTAVSQRLLHQMKVAARAAKQDVG
jgi:hypothetical protein